MRLTKARVDGDLNTVWPNQLISHKSGWREGHVRVRGEIADDWALAGWL
jgi:hypothetical protein